MRHQGALAILISATKQKQEYHSGACLECARGGRVVRPGRPGRTGGSGGGGGRGGGGRVDLCVEASRRAGLNNWQTA